MSLRRTVLACAVTFVCALAVFTLPRVAWNTAQAALGQQPVVADSVSRTPTPSAPTRSPQAAPRSLGQRLTGVFGIALILGLGLALSRHRRAISWRVVAWGVGLQLAFAIVMNKVMGASGAESLNVAASIFMGQTEAPLTIRPFLPRMTRSELMTVMTAGMAHVSGSIMAAYIAFGIEARHLLTAVIMTAPGTIMMAKIIEPETETPETLGGVRVQIPRTDVNVVDAAARGTTDGLHLMLNVIAMLISFIALIALLNGGFG